MTEKKSTFGDLKNLYRDKTCEHCGITYPSGACPDCPDCGTKPQDAMAPEPDPPAWPPKE